MSLAAFEIVTMKNLFSMRFAARLNLAIYSVMELFMLSRASENLKMETEKIAESIYESRWFDVKKDKKKIRHLVRLSLLRASKPVRISALGFSNISYETFVSVSLEIHFLFNI